MACGFCVNIMVGYGECAGECINVRLYEWMYYVRDFRWDISRMMCYEEIEAKMDETNDTESIR